MSGTKDYQIPGSFHIHPDQNISSDAFSCYERVINMKNRMHPQDNSK